MLVMATGCFLAVKSLGQLKSSAKPAEITQIMATTDLQKQAQIYRQLIKRVGPEKAQDLLYQSGLPFTGQTHLLNHTVGDYLYETYGKSGLVHCRDYFLSSCYHGFLLHIIGAHPEQNFQQLADVLSICKQQGMPTLSQCSHAVGHGFVAAIDYKNLDRAVSLCDQASKSVPNLILFNCQDGAFMENVFGVHSGTPSPNRWVKTDDSNYPCDDPRFPNNAIGACWSNQPSLLYQQYQGDIPRIATVCQKVTDPNWQSICYDGLARQIHPITQGQPAMVMQLCGQVTESWVSKCIASNVRASFSVGDRDTVFKICPQAPSEDQQECYQSLDSVMRAYLPNLSDRQAFCDRIQDAEWRQRCSQ